MQIKNAVGNRRGIQQPSKFSKIGVRRTSRLGLIELMVQTTEPSNVAVMDVAAVRI